MKSLTRSTAFAVAALLVSGLAFAETPAFLILQENGAFTDHVRAIQASGAHVRQRVPPRILIVDVPNAGQASALPGVQLAYTSAVPVSSLEAQGPAAVAAGLQFNRRLLSESRPAGVSTMGAMRQLVADKSLPPPGNLRVAPAAGRFFCEWEGVDGAAYYEVQASGSLYFEEGVVRTNTTKTGVEISSPEGASDVHVRVRAIDPGNGSAEDAIKGRWSSTIRAVPVAGPASGGSAPVLTSPVNGLETEGFTLILEWTPGEGPARVQVARDANFTDTVFDEVVSGGEYACPGPALRTGDRLYWRVQSLDGVRSPWSPSREARIGEPRSSKIDAFVNPEAPR